MSLAGVYAVTVWARLHAHDPSSSPKKLGRPRRYLQYIRSLHPTRVWCTAKHTAQMLDDQRSEPSSGSRFAGLTRRAAAVRIQSVARGRQGRLRSERLRADRTIEADVRFYVTPVSELRIEIVKPSNLFASGGDGVQMLQYRLVGDAAARSLLNRLSKPNEDSDSILGSLAPLSPVTLTAEAKAAAHIPVDAAFFAFAYPLECLNASSKALFEAIIGSVSRYLIQWVR